MPDRSSEIRVVASTPLEKATSLCPLSFCSFYSHLAKTPFNHEAGDLPYSILYDGIEL
jgi:hypothetical protein